MHTSFRSALGRAHDHSIASSTPAPAKQTRTEALEIDDEHVDPPTLGDAWAREQRAPDWPADDSLAEAMGLVPGATDADYLAFGAGPGPAGGAAPAAAKAAAPKAAGPVPAPAVSPSSAAPKAGKPKAAPKPAPVPVPSTEEPAQLATWTEVAAATTDAGKAALDLTWIDALPAHVKDSIDADFSQTARDTAYEREDTSLSAKAKADFTNKEKALYARVSRRLSPKAPRTKADKAALAAAVHADSEYTTELAALDAAYKQALADARQALTDKLDTAQRHTDKPSESLVTPPAAKISRLEGVARSRTDFMSWALEITGSAEKVKAHYQSIRPVPGRPRLWLAADAAARFSAATAAFEAAHPGYTIGSSSGHAMRRLHQDRKGIGMHGHSLGLAFDILAYDNPNLDAPDGDPPTINDFFLKRFGRDDQARARTRMSIPGHGDGRIEALGKQTAAGTTTADGEALVATIRAQFAELSGTSKRFQASLAAQMPLLREARDIHFKKAYLLAEIGAIKSKLNTARSATKTTAALTEALADREDKLSGLEKRGDADVLMATAFSAWITALEQDREQALANKQLAKGNGAQGGNNEAYYDKELRILDVALAKLKDPKAIFGEGQREKDGSYSSKLEVTRLPLMQYLERGFVRDDAMPAHSERGRKGVFNADVVETLVRHGFAPGSTFGDTMHFDFIEGYSNVAQGGRSRANMQKHRYGPKGTLGKDDP